MPPWIISALLGVGVATWAYNKLARSNGNANPQSNLLMAGVIGFILFLIMLSLLTLVLNY